LLRVPMLSSHLRRKQLVGIGIMKIWISTSVVLSLKQFFYGHVTVYYPI
jgi:hypothetical protein